MCSRLTEFAILFLVGMLTAFTPKQAEAQYSKEEIAKGQAVTRSVKGAEQAYYDRKYDLAGKNIRKGINQLHEAMKSENDQFRAALEKLATRLDRVHLRVEMEGISLPPFRLDRLVDEDDQFSGTMFSTSDTSPTSKTPPKPPTPAPSDPTMAGTLVSFTRQVAPILNRRCGRCHVQTRRGKFSLASYSDLMKGPPEGVVVFPEDIIGSRLLETIETGDMPRGGGRVSETELKTLKDWVLQGAKFDGNDPNASIAGATATAPATSPTPMTPTVKQASGDETISFVSQIAPLLVDNCTGCHIDAMQVRGGLRMDTFTRLMRGGDSGAIVTPGQGEASLLVKKLRGTAADGDRMPAGGRPALSDDSIALVSKWIDEGATIDGDPEAPVKVLSRLAWVSRATSAQVTKRRAELATKNFALANSSVTPTQHNTEHFRLVGTSSQETIELVGRIAERHLKTAKSIAKPKNGSTAEDYFHGKSTIFVMPKRYDYSEFTKMVEQRSVPTDWTSHWHSDGEDAYVVAVGSDRDTDEDLEARLLSPVVSLAVATRGVDIPRWFAEGLGGAISLQQNAKSRSEQEKLRMRAVEAASSVKKAQDFLNDRLTPEQSDSFGASLALSMLDRGRRKSLDACFRSLAEGKPFDEAFFNGFGMTPVVYIDQFLQFMR